MQDNEAHKAKFAKELRQREDLENDLKAIQKELRNGKVHYHMGFVFLSYTTAQVLIFTCAWCDQ